MYFFLNTKVITSKGYKSADYVHHHYTNDDIIHRCQEEEQRSKYNKRKRKFVKIFAEFCDLPQGAFPR